MESKEYEKLIGKLDEVLSYQSSIKSFQIEMREKFDLLWTRVDKHSYDRSLSEKAIYKLCSEIQKQQVLDKEELKDLIHLNEEEVKELIHKNEKETMKELSSVKLKLAVVAIGFGAGGGYIGNLF